MKKAVQVPREGEGVFFSQAQSAKPRDANEIRDRRGAIVKSLGEKPTVFLLDLDRSVIGRRLVFLEVHKLTNRQSHDLAAGLLASGFRRHQETLQTVSLFFSCWVTPRQPERLHHIWNARRAFDGLLTSICRPSPTAIPAKGYLAGAPLVEAGGGSFIGLNSIKR